jgi:ribosomal protein L11 methyltransferase
MMARQWQIEFRTPDYADVFAEMVEAAADAESVSSHCGDDWHVLVITAGKPDGDKVKFALDQARQITGVEASGVDITPLPVVDWLAENRKSFPPLEIGPFWVYGDHVAIPVPTGKIGLKIDAGGAFGSGSHGTTRGCAMMLAKHCPDAKRLKIADIGCGSGILAMAAAKLRPDATIVAVDNDQIAVDVAADNFKQNDVAFIHRGQSDGYGAELVKKYTPYDVITANILPKPLTEMAGDAAACLALQGVLIVSGLMEMHRRDVIAAHQSAGLELIDSESIDDWTVLVMQKKAG